MGKSIGVIGDGGWGTALSIVLNKNGHFVTLWSPFEEYAKVLREKRENIKFLPKVAIPKEIEISSDLVQAVSQAEFVVFAIPTLYARKVLNQLKELDFSKKIFVSVSKGIENETLLRLSEIIHESLGKIPLVLLSGPTHAEEVALGIPSSIVASSRDPKLAQSTQKVFTNDHFRVYTNPDMVGVELGGALKNVIAIAAGISDGLGLGDNAKAALMTRGLAEISRLAKAMGAHPQTLSGLSGMGDLITTCISSHSRNRKMGEVLASGISLDQALSNTERVAEGVKTTQSAYHLAQKYKVEMPIVEGVYAVLYEGKAPTEIIENLMKRRAKIENSEWN